MVIKYTEALRFNLSKMKSEIDEMRTRYEVDHDHSASRDYSTSTASSEYSTAREDKSTTESDFTRTGKSNTPARGFDFFKVKYIPILFL